MNIYAHELKLKLRSVLVWSLSMAALILIFMSLFQGFSSSTIAVSDIMDKFPKELLIAFGMLDMDWSTVLGFYALIFVFVQICLAIQGANYGFGLVSIEETEWTADFLLSKPVQRSQIMSAKLLAALTAIAITQALIWISTFVFVEIFSAGDPYDTGILTTLLLTMTVFELFFLTVGMAISLLVRRIRNVLPYSMGLVFGLYILNAFGSMIGEQSLEVISPFKHFSPNAIIKSGAWDTSLVWISALVIVITLAASYFLYERRNIASAV